MTAKELLKLASKDLSPFMDRHEYHRRAVGHFVKSEETLEKWITLTLSKWSNGSGFHVDHYAAYRLPAFTEINNRYLSFISDKEKKLTPTISNYFYNLIPVGFDWNSITVMKPSDIPIVARNIEQICELYSFPFLDRFSTVDAIINGFRGGRATWAVEDPILRIQLLLLDAVLKRDAFTFNSWYEEAVRFCGNRTDGAAVNLMMLAHSLKNDYF